MSGRFAPATGKRQSVTVKRLEETQWVGQKKEKKWSIVPGEGTPLSDIPRIAERIDKKRLDDVTLVALNKSIFARTKKSLVKKNLRQFSGLNDEYDEAKVRPRLDKLKTTELRDICRLFDIKATGKKDEVLDEIVSFLKKPHETENPPKQVTAKPKTTKKKKKKKTSASKAGDATSKGSKRKGSSGVYAIFKDMESDRIEKVASEQGLPLAKAAMSVWKELGIVEKQVYYDMADDVSTTDEAPAAKKRKVTKPAASKKKKATSSASGSGPSEAEVRTYVQSLLDEREEDLASLDSVLKLLKEKFDFNFASRKAMVRRLLMEIVEDDEDDDDDDEDDNDDDDAGEDEKNKGDGDQ